MVNELKILPELEYELRTLSEMEERLLRESLVREGCRDALVVWHSSDGVVLCGGHNRYRICRELGIGFRTLDGEFKDIDEVKRWVRSDQLGKRNLSGDEYDEYLGRLCIRVREEQGDGRGSIKEVVEKSGVNRQRLCRSAERVALADRIVGVLGEEFRGSVRKLSMKRLVEIGGMSDADIVPEVLESPSREPIAKPPIVDVSKDDKSGDESAPTSHADGTKPSDEQADEEPIVDACGLFDIEWFKVAWDDAIDFDPKFPYKQSVLTVYNTVRIFCAMSDARGTTIKDIGGEEF